MSYVERLTVTDESQQTILYDEHLVRYQFAAGFVKDKTVLDIACGSGYGAAILAQTGAQSVIGIDISEEAIKQAQKNYQQAALIFKQGQAAKLELADKSVELITSFETIEHLNDADSFLKELARVVTADGLVFISTPNWAVYQQKNPWHVKEFTKEEFLEILQKYFSTVRIFEQKNGLTSIVRAAEPLKDTEEGNILINDNKSEALYFIAVCSKKEINEKFRSVSSVNIRALKNWENNPGWRLINFFYKIFHG